MLNTYLTRNGLSRAQFAARIGVTPEAVRKYLGKERIPTREVMERIVEETSGEVTANDFFGIAA